MSAVWLRMSSVRTQAMDEIRVVAAKWRFFYHPVRVLAHVPPQCQIDITLDDLEHLLVDPGRDGWLNGELIETALRMYALTAAEVTQVVSPRSWTQWVNDGYQLSTLPELSPAAWQILIPVHSNGTHWALAVLDRRHRQKVWLDSAEGSQVTRPMAFATLQKFINYHPSLFQAGVWTSSDLRSTRQHNSFDCGMFVVQNARARTLGEDRAEAFNGYVARSALANELFELADKMNPAVPFSPCAGTAGQPISVEERELQKGQIAASKSNQPPTGLVSRQSEPPRTPPRGLGQSPKGPAQQDTSPLFFSPPPRQSPQSPASPLRPSSSPIGSPRPAIPDLGRLSIQRAPPPPPPPPPNPQQQRRSVGGRHAIGFDYTRPTTRRMSSKLEDQAGPDESQDH